MGHKTLYIWVEGDDDKRFFETIMEPILKKKYNYVSMICYATLKDEKVDNFLRSIKAMNADYIFVTDINNSPCATDRKKYRTNLQESTQVK